MFDISKFAAERQVPSTERSIETITTEILQMKEDAGNAIIGIGQHRGDRRQRVLRRQQESIRIGHAGGAGRGVPGTAGGGEGRTAV